MLNILSVEIFRLKKSVLFWVMLGLTVAFPLLGAVSTLMVTGFVDSSAGESVISLSNLNITKQFLQGMASLSNWALIFALITSAIVLSSEFVDGTMRNVLLANKSRAQLYFSYLIIAVSVGLIYFLAYYATVLLIIAPIFGFDAMSAGPAVTASLCSFAQGIVGIVFAESCMAMFLFSMRKQWASILFPLLICIFLPSLVLTFATLIITTASIKTQQVPTLVELRWVPFANGLVYNPAEVDGIGVGMNILYLALFTAMFILIGYYTFKKADLK